MLVVTVVLLLLLIVPPSSAAENSTRTVSPGSRHTTASTVKEQKLPGGLDERNDAPASGVAVLIFIGIIAVLLAEPGGHTHWHHH
jgi:hypothetical protein